MPVAALTPLAFSDAQWILLIGFLIPVLILCGENAEHRRTVQTARLFHIPVTEFHTEKDLDLWRK